MARNNSKPPQSASQPSASDGNEPVDAEFLASTAWVPDAISDDHNDGNTQAGGANEAADAIPPELIASALGPSFQAVFHFMATKRGAHWELADFEKTALVKGWTPILQYVLAKLGSQEQVLLTLAVGSTVAIVGGKAAQDIKRASSRASTKTRESAASFASSDGAGPEKPLVPNGLYEEQSEL